LPSTGLDYGYNGAIPRSSEILQWLKENDRFDIIHFQGSKGTAYYTLTARKQGLVCLRSQIVVSADAMPASYIKKVNNNNLDMVVDEVELLRLDYMEQKSLELAVRSLFSFFFFFSFLPSLLSFSLLSHFLLALFFIFFFNRTLL